MSSYLTEPAMLGVGNESPRHPPPQHPQFSCMLLTLPGLATTHTVWTPLGSSHLEVLHIRTKNETHPILGR